MVSPTFAEAIVAACAETDAPNISAVTIGRTHLGVMGGTLLEASRDVFGMLERGWSAVTGGLISPGALLKAGASVAPKPPDMLPGETPMQYINRSQSAVGGEAYPALTRYPGESPTEYLKRSNTYIQKLGSANEAQSGLEGMRAGLSGAASDTANLGSSLTSPMSIALMGSGPLAKALPVAGKVAGTARAALKGTEAAASLGFGGKGAADIVTAGIDNTPEAWQKRLQGASQMVAGGAGLADVAPSFQRAQEWLQNKIYPRVGQNAVNVAKPANTFSDLLSRPIGQFLPPQVKTVLSDFISRMAPNAAPMNFEELHQWTSDINNWIFSKEGKGLPPKSFELLKRGVVEAREALNHSADAGGVGDYWNGYNREYAKATKVGKGANAAGAALGAASGGALGFEASAPMPGPMRYLATSAGATAGGFAGKRVVGGMVDSVLNRNPSARLPIVAGSASDTAQSIMDMAKRGLISPGEADRRIARLGQSVKVNPLPRIPY
jgi:outer membrane lipoprotein SlyB